MEDVIEVIVLEDGTIRSTTPKISSYNHSNAGEFFKLLARTTGGAQTASKRNKALEGHSHASDHAKNES